MPEYILPGADAPSFQTLTPFAQAYVEALFFTDGEQFHLDGCGNGTFLADSSEAPGFSDIAPEALAKIVADCAAFEVAAFKRFPELAPDGDNPWEPRQAGHDFWLTRQGHGAGFWDGDWDEPHGTGLTELSKAAGEVSPYLGDDGKVYL